MSASTIERQTTAILAASRDLDVRVTAIGPLQWALSVPAWPSTVAARLDGDWLFLESALPAGPGPWTHWELLRWNSRLAGPGKFALAPDGRSGFRAELPLAEPGVLPARLRGWCADLAAVADRLSDPGEAPPPAPPAAGEAACDGASAREQLGPACEAAGWPFTEGSASQLRVPLDLPEGYHQACIDLHSDDTVRASVELARFDRLSRLGRRALGILLLGASGLVRLARGAIRADGDEEVRALFEVRFSLPLGEGELHHALSALATAARLCGREVDALRGELLAKTYLRVHEPGSGEIRLTETTTRENQEDLHATQ
jgi:hypothetical protein